VAANLVFKTADQSKNSDTTFADDPDLLQSVVSGHAYGFQMCIRAIMASAGGGNLKVRLNANGSGFGSVWGGAATTSIASAVTNSFPMTLTTTITVYYFFGTFVATGTGNVNLQWAQNTNVAINTTLQAGSWWLMYE